MIIDPNKIMEEGIIKNLDGEPFVIQQNGIDLTLGSLEKVKGGVLGITHREINEYEQIYFTENESGDDPEEWMHLQPGCYSIMFEQEVDIPAGMCAQIIQRSTLNRMGGYILSGLYDSGFKNVLGAILRVDESIHLQKGARVAQVIFHEAESASLYEGIYQKKS